MTTQQHNKQQNIGDKMADKDTVNSHKQQVLFDESELLTKTKTETKNSSVLGKQILFDQDENLAVVTASLTQDEMNTDELAKQQLTNTTNQIIATKFSWLWRIIISLLLIIVLIEGAQFFIDGFRDSPIITSIYATLLALLSVMSFRTLWQEFSGLRQFRQQQTLKQQAIEFLSSEFSSDLSPGLPSKENRTKYTKTRETAEQFCHKLNDSLPCDLAFDNSKEQEVWREAVSSGLSSKELVQLYSRVVLSKVDEKALNEVGKFSTEAVVLVALSPVALIDMLIMLSRNLRMINKIAGLYGLKLGYWSRIKLIKQVFINMAYAGASEIISDFGSDMLGAELLGKLSARFAQGLGAGMLTARLGVQTMQLCRPIPFDDKPKLNHVRKKIIKQIKELVSPKAK